MSVKIQTLGSDKSLRTIFRTLQNQCSEIFSGAHNADSASIMKCLENLAELISSDDDYIEELELFIDSGVCHIARNYGAESNTNNTVSSVVLNFLMTAIRSYNHNSKEPYRFKKDKCPNTNSHGNALLAQVLHPMIDAGAHAVPIDNQLLTFNVLKKYSPRIRSPSPKVGPRHKPISFGKTVKTLQRTRRQSRGYRSNSSDTGSASDGGRAQTGGNNNPQGCCIS